MLTYGVTYPGVWAERRKYNYQSLRDLLRAIRNKKNHFRCTLLLCSVACYGMLLRHPATTRFRTVCCYAGSYSDTACCYAVGSYPNRRNGSSAQYQRATWPILKRNFQALSDTDLRAVLNAYGGTATRRLVVQNARGGTRVVVLNGRMAVPGLVLAVHGFAVGERLHRESLFQVRAGRALRRNQRETQPVVPQSARNGVDSAAR
eukprot:2635281-Rhodomonas_salina.3